MRKIVYLFCRSVSKLFLSLPRNGKPMMMLTVVTLVGIGAGCVLCAGCSSMIRKSHEEFFDKDNFVKDKDD